MSRHLNCALYVAISAGGGHQKRRAAISSRFGFTGRFETENYQAKTAAVPMKSRLSPSRLAFWGGAVFLASAEALTSLVRAHFLTDTPFFRVPALFLTLALLKGLVFGPMLGILTRRAWHFWKRKEWDSACYVCLRGGFALCATQGAVALLAFLSRSRFPLLSWLSTSWLHFAFWLTLNVALIWALLLLVAGFLLPSNARKTVQVGEKLRF
jgi:hypothetical protein